MSERVSRASNPRGAPSRWTARAQAYLPALLGSSLLATFALRGVLRRVGQAAFPLDDAFIHLQYARRLAQGGFFEYVDGLGYSSGATSLLWPTLLAPWFVLGLDGRALIWISWGLGTLAHAALVLETHRLARPLLGSAGARIASTLAWAFGAFAWFAWSGMETLGLAWVLLRGARIASERCEAWTSRSEAGRYDGPRAWALVSLAFVAPLLRPEGALVCGFSALALGMAPPRFRGRPRWWTRPLALLPLLGPAVPPLLHWKLAGHAVSSTATAKWLLGNPWWAPRAPGLIRDNLRLLLTDLMAGGNWTALFLPEGAHLPILGGLVLLPLAAWRSRRPMRAVFLALVAAGAMLPCTYLTFLDNRVRYVWPFAGAWLILAATFATELGRGARWCARALGIPERTALGLTPALGFGMAGILASKLPWTFRDLAESAHAIDRQQVSLGQWVAAHLPLDARVGVNDTGALAYFGQRPTFDVVGLTTEGEARYWAAGAGPRFEHYEKLPPERRPTHFVVYPQWMDCPPVLGAELHSVTVTDQSILGGPTMVVHEARWDLVGSGAQPRTLRPGERVLDALDVADLESESLHAFERRGAYPTWTVAGLWGERGSELADGGRTHRSADRFELRVPPTGGALLARIGASERTVRVQASVDGRALGTVELEAGQIEELRFELSAGPAGLARFELRTDGSGDFSSYHYWTVTESAP